MKKIIFTFITVLFLFNSNLLARKQMRDQIRIVGSSTVYPFTTTIAEEFGHGKFKTPIIESTGTGGGFKLFCAGIGNKFPDFTNASRKIKDSEVKLCQKNGVEKVSEFKIGYDGIVIANSLKAHRYSFTKVDIFLALAKEVPKNGKLVKNYYNYWDEVNPVLPHTNIEFYGPPPTSGTRDAFVELVMESSCKKLPIFKSKYADKKQLKIACHQIREDGKYIEAGENDNLIVQKLVANEKALGIFGYSFLEENGQSVQGSIVENEDPSFENIASGKYKISRPLFVYAKDQHADLVKGFRQFVKELLSDEAIGQEGYVVEKGLIPLPEDKLLLLQKKQM